MKTILITGGGGFIGSNLAAALTARNTHRVVVCDAFGTSDKWRNLVNHPVWEIVPPEELFEWLNANVMSLEMIFHTAAISSTTENDIDLILKNNLSLSVKLWRWCNQHAVRLVYSSAAATYGDGALGFDDSAELDYLRALKPLSGYGWSKHLFDLHVAGAVARSEQTLPQWVGLKLFNVYGPNEYHKENQRSVICQIAGQAIHGGSIRLFRSGNANYPDGGQLRDVLYVKDVVAVMLWLLDNPSVSGLFNLGTGKARTFADMANAIFAALGRPPRIHYIDMPEELINKYQYFTEARMEKLRQAGYSAPFTSVEDGIRDYVLNYLTKEDPYL
jgi:ADP-L-glycero-D-manno-heptose 6-epimerase